MEFLRGAILDFYHEFLCSECTCQAERHAFTHQGTEASRVVLKFGTHPSVARNIHSAHVDSPIMNANAIAFRQVTYKNYAKCTRSVRQQYRNRLSMESTAAK